MKCDFCYKDLTQTETNITLQRHLVYFYIDN